MPRSTAPPLDGRRLRELRAALGLSVDDLAARVGLSYQHVNNVEAGRKGVSELAFRRIAHALDVNASDLVKATPDLEVPA